MPQSKEVHKEYMRRRREGSQEGSQTEGSQVEVHTEYPAILRALVDPKKRAMLEFISEDLKQKHLGHQLSYGVNGPDFDMVGELLQVTD